MIAIGGVIVSDSSYPLISPILTLVRAQVSSWERAVICNMVVLQVYFLATASWLRFCSR